ncbi:hypothetical protein [Desulfitobacterium sp. AusDCA]|uniref:hypothetical protein n=1 Tax=Desulfitobacterium sp. AusDCA TaxID=3240383 RepID=UPI003DA76F49
MEKFNNGKPFTYTILDKPFVGPHGKENEKFALCPYGKSTNLPFCDHCKNLTPQK